MKNKTFYFKKQSKNKIGAKKFAKQKLKNIKIKQIWIRKKTNIK